MTRGTCLMVLAIVGCDAAEVAVDAEVAAMAVRAH